MTLKEKILEIVKKIPPGKFLTYKQVAQLSGDNKAYRLVGYLMKNNKDTSIPCHRIIKNNYEVGNYNNLLVGKNKKIKSEFLKTALLLKEGAIGIIPTDTIYGISTSGFNKKSVEQIYKLRKRDPQKPFIILINSLLDLKLFKIEIRIKKKIFFLKKIWPSRISIILPCDSNNFFYLHRGTKTLAFRIPKKKILREMLKISGPIVAPSANWENYPPASNIREAKKYFNNKVFYLNGGELKSQSSTLIDFTSSQIRIIRKGADYKKLMSLFKIFNFI